MNRVVRFGVRGQFVDAFVYRTQLFLVTWQGDLRVYDVGELERGLKETVGPAGEMASRLMFHARGLGLPRGARMPTSEETKELSGDLLWLEGDEIPHQSVDLGLRGHSILDVLIYNDRLYLGSQEGLLSADLTQDLGALTLESRLGFVCYSAKVSLGAVAASCGENGLNILFNDFSWMDRPSRKTVAEPESIRATYAGLGLVNYTSKVDFRVLNGRVVKGAGHLRQQAFISFSRTDFGRDDLFRRVSEQTEGGDLEYAFNYGSRFIAFAAGQVVSLAMRAEDGGRSRRVLSPKVMGQYRGRVIEAQSLGQNVIVEMQDSVLVFREGEAPEEAFAGPIASLRAFPRSKRYTELAALVAEEGVVLFSTAPRRLATEVDPH